MVVIPKNVKQEKNSTTRDYYRIFIYGKPAVGKTQLIDDIPDLLMLNTDGNINYTKSPHILLKDTVKVDRRGNEEIVTMWENFKSTILSLVDDENGYKTIAVDLVDDIYTSCRMYTFRENEIEHESDDAFRAWDKVTLEFLTGIKILLSLPYNIIFVGHESEIRDIMTPGNPIKSIEPLLRAKIAEKLMGWCDFTARYELTSRGERNLQLLPDRIVTAGSHIPDTPKKIDAKLEEIFKIIGGNNNE